MINYMERTLLYLLIQKKEKNKMITIKKKTYKIHKLFPVNLKVFRDRLKIQKTKCQVKCVKSMIILYSTASISFICLFTWKHV